MSAMPPRGAFAQAMPLTYAPRPHGPEALVRRHLPMVRRLAWHVHGAMSTAVEVEDLVQVGLVALVEAAGAGEPGDPAFASYLHTRIRGAMIDELRRHATSTRGAMRRRRAYAEAVRALTGELGRSPSEVETAARLGVTVERLRTEYQTAEAVRMESIDELYADDQPWFASDAPSAFDQLAEADQRDALVAAVAALPEREALVIQLYHAEELNLEEIGEVLGVGAARVCQIKAAAHGRLRKALAALR